MHRAFQEIRVAGGRVVPVEMVTADEMCKAKELIPMWTFAGKELLY